MLPTVLEYRMKTLYNANCTLYPKCIKSDTPLQIKDNRVPFDFVARIASRGDNDAIEIIAHTGPGV